MKNAAKELQMKAHGQMENAAKELQMKAHGQMENAAKEQIKETSFSMAGILFPLMQIVTMDSQ